MGFRLSKAQARDWDERCTQLSKIQALAESEFATLLQELDMIVAPLNDLIRRYIDAATEVRTLAEAIATEHRESYDERSE